MKTKKYWILAAVVICCIVFLSATVFGISIGEKIQLERIGISTLHGLEGVNPVVSLIAGKETKLHSISEHSLQNKVELEFRKAGIRVADANVGGRFHVLVKVEKISDLSVYYIYVIAELVQEVRLTRDPAIRAMAATWSSQFEPMCQGAFAGEAVVDKMVEEEIGEVITIFINDYLAANPKEQAAKRDSIEKRRENASGKR